MARVFLQDMVDDLRFDDLPAPWTAFDLATLAFPYRDYMAHCVISTAIGTS